MTPEQMLPRIRALLGAGDLDTLAQAQELLEVVGTPEMFGALCEDIGLDLAGVPTVGRSSIFIRVRDLSQRQALMVWLLRRAGRLDGVTRLALQGISRAGFAEVEGLPALEHLTLRGIDWGDDLSALLRLPALRSLTLGRGSRLSALAGHPTLQSLSISEHDDEVARVLASLPVLRSLSITPPRGAGAVIPAALPALEALSITVGSRELGWLGRFPRLTELSLSCVRGIHVSSLVPLSGLVRLTRLALWEHDAPAAVDLAPLSGLSRLESLSIPGHPAVDLTPLHGLSRLRSVTLGGGVYDPNLQRTDALYRSLGPMQQLLVGVGLDQTGAPTRDGVPMKPQEQLLALHVTPPAGQAHPLADVQRLSLFCHSRCALDLAPLAELSRLKWLKVYSSGTFDLTPLALLPALEHLEGREQAEGRDAVRRLQRRLAQRLLSSTRFHRTARDEAWLERLRAMGLLGSRRRQSPPAGISRLLASNRLEDVLAGFEDLSRLPDHPFTQRVADGVTLARDGQLVLSHAAERSPHLRRKARRAFCALMALRVSGRLEGAEHIHLGPNQPLTALDPLDRLPRLARLVLRGGGKLTDLSPLTRMPSLRYLDLSRCTRLPADQQQVFEGDQLAALIEALSTPETIGG